MPLTFIHLSDIHVQGGGRDLDDDVRREVLLDVRRCVSNDVTPHGVLISGDVAFSGRESQYDTARQWLRSLTDALGCEPSRVWTVPGNHDIDWAAIADNDLLQMVQARFRPDPALDDHQVNAMVREACEGKGSSQILLAPLEAYNAFTAGYGGRCETTVDGLAWHEDIPLNDGSTLRLWGINSVVVSNREDDINLNRLIVSAHQLPGREPGVALLTLCHHPPEWIRDADQLTDLLNNRASVQLFGHRHRRRSTRIGDSVVFHAGALHPERGHDDWTPRYNIFELAVEGEGDQRQLHVRVQARTWNHGEARFGPFAFGESLVGDFRVPLEPWTPPDPPPADPPPLDGVQDPTAPSADDTPGLTIQPEGAMDSMRSLVYAFYDLPYRHRQKVIVDLDLLRDGDKGVSERELVRRVVERVRREHREDAFREAIAAIA